ncbi:MAG TPA: GPW/gp25 family protein [Polyangiaceae bacterium]|nr:GPW/gp25 family protein [Polyangiaceae bacterium]
MTERTWQAKVGAPGVVVTGLEELAQSLSTIVTTPLGAVPGRPLFGCEVASKLIDEPINIIQAQAPGMVDVAVKRNDPRITIDDVRVVQGDSAGHVKLQIYWHPTAQPDAAIRMTEVELHAHAA